MGCGNTKAQKDIAADPTNVAADSKNTRAESPMTSQQQQQYQQQQEYQQQQDYQQLQQQRRQQQQQYEQRKLSADIEGRREDWTNKSQEVYQHQQSARPNPVQQSPLQNSQRVSAIDDDNSPPSYSKPNYPQNFDKNTYYNDPSPVSSNQQSVNPNFKNYSSFEQPERLKTPQRAEQSLNVAETTTANESKIMKIPRDDAATPHILFAFDFKNKDFNFYNYKKNQWDLNNLGRSTEDCPKCPLFKYRIPGEEAEGLQFARYMSYIALSDEVIFIIGGYNSYYSCLEYNIISNKFYAREPLKNFRNNPSLCRYGQYIYAVSGDLLDKFSTDIARFDTQRNQWVTLPELPSPQGFASVAVINGVKGSQPSEKTLKLAVLGGLSHKFPKTHTSILSLFSFDEEKWTSFDLSRFIETKIPKFVHCPIVQTKEGDIVIFGTEGSRSVYNFDVFNMKLTTAGRLPNDESFNESMKSKEAFCYNDKIFCLAYKLELKVYQGSISANKWEII